MSEQKIMDEPLVFGLDIGTRNVVGTVGYRIDDNFIVVAQYMREHETRAMLDGQIHDIGRVGNTIRKVKEQLESQLGMELTEVCIAAAGRVLKTVTTNIEYAFDEETLVTGEDIHTLDLMGIEKAQDLLKEYNDTRYKFYCVGYSVMHYYLNGEPFSSLESHKAEVISEDIIVTFLPEDVVDGLYAAVGLAGLSVANMTLEPIAAINVAIPENFRLLNIALVDIGAGTSDICITRDGSIIAYGMIPLAGDEITELIVQNYLVDFRTAESIKAASGKGEDIVYKDIMLIEHTIPAEDVWELTEPVVERMTTEVAAKIKELNGDKTVSATFIVGGGGKIHGYTEKLAQKLDLPEERVALRGEEVLQEVIFEQEEIEKDPLLVTPIGICLNYFDQKNSFIMVRFNGERVKLYDNNKLTVVDVALAAGFPNEDLFPKRGKELSFTVDGATRVVRGKPGESAVIFMNDRPANINTPLEPNSDIIIEPSTQGEDAACTLEQLEEYSGASVAFIVNGKVVRCPRFLEVNGSLELPSYQIEENDKIETRGFYTVGQLVEFMDVELDTEHEIMVNNRPATFETLIYENFSIEWVVLSYGAAYVEPAEWRRDLTPETAQPAVTQEELEKVQKQAAEAAETLNGMLAEIVTDPDLPEEYKTYGISGASAAGALQTQKLTGRELNAQPERRVKQEPPKPEDKGTKQEERQPRRERVTRESTGREDRAKERGAASKTERGPAARGSAVSILEDMERLHDELRARMIQKAKEKEQQEAKQEKEPEAESAAAPAAEPVREQEPGNVEELITMLQSGALGASGQGLARPAATQADRREPGAVKQPTAPDSMRRDVEAEAAMTPASGRREAEPETVKRPSVSAPVRREAEPETVKRSPETVKREPQAETEREPTVSASVWREAEPETVKRSPETVKREPQAETEREPTVSASVWREAEPETVNQLPVSAPVWREAGPETENQPSVTAPVWREAEPETVNQPPVSAPVSQEPKTEAENQPSLSAPLWQESKIESLAAPVAAEKPSVSASVRREAEPESEKPQNVLLSVRREAQPEALKPSSVWQAPKPEAVKQPFVSAPSRQEARIEAPTAKAIKAPGNSGNKSGTTERPDAQATELHIFINGESVTLKGRKEYIFVNVFDVYEFDLSEARGREIVTLHNGFQAKYTDELKEGDKIELRWKERD